MDMVRWQLQQVYALVPPGRRVNNRLVGGQEFTVQGGATGAGGILTWQGGVGQTGYLIARIAPSGVVFLPSTGPLGPSQTSFVDDRPLTDPFAFYVLISMGAAGSVLAVSDALGVLPGAPSGAQPPTSFQIRGNEMGALVLTWNAPTAQAVRGPGGVTRYVLAAAPTTPGATPRLIELGLAERRAVDAPGQTPTCYLLLAYAGQVQVGATSVLCAYPGVASPPSVRINEVESNQGVPGDWVELYNPGPNPVDLSGYGFKDNDDTRTFTIPAGTTIASNGYYILEEAAFGFGLGASDSARLYAPGGATLVDSYTWTAHAVTTYGRCGSGSGAFAVNTTVTKGAANDCSVAVVINEIESSGGTPGDWVELFNPSPAPANLDGFVFQDNDDTHVYTIPQNTVIAGNGFYVLEEAALGFGLGTADSARLFRPDGSLADSYTWTAHASTTYGRCPSGVGAFAPTVAVTKGAANDCGGVPTSIRINEVESNGGTPGDWVELYNQGATPVDLGGLVFKDNDDTRTYAIPAGTMIPGNGFYILEEAAFGFGLGAGDAARLYAPGGLTLLDSYTWTEHATTTYGRCPDGTGAFAATTTVTKGAANVCTGGTTALPWPGSATVQTVDAGGVFGGNLSGLTYEASGSATPGVLWAARNGPGMMFRLVWNGTIWTPDPTNGWGAGKTLRYPDGTGSPDAESLAFAATASAMYVSTERNNDASAVSRNSILRFDTTVADATLVATNEWNLTSSLPTTGANLGIEAITWIPDAFLTSRGFFDDAKGRAYAPADYPDHGTGLFFLGIEANGSIYAYALNHTNNSFSLVATIVSGFSGAMALEFDRELSYLWVTCDDGCGGRSGVLEVNGQGRFAVTRLFERPPTMPNLNNEGFTMAAQAECVSGQKAAYWADDGETSGFALRRGSVPCTPFPAP